MAGLAVEMAFDDEPMSTVERAISERLRPELEALVADRERLELLLLRAYGLLL